MRDATLGFAVRTYYLKNRATFPRRRFSEFLGRERSERSGREALLDVRSAMLL